MAPFLFELKTCVWEITLACPFRCRYCGSGGGKKRDGELTTAECLDVARQLATMGCRRVSLIGGEVFERDDWDVIAEELTKSGIKTCIITNGYSMTDEILASLKRINIESVAVSIDGPEEIHDRYRQKGSYKRAIEAVNRLGAEGIPVSVISALRADNAPLVPSFYETVKTLPVFAWQLQACSPMGNARKNGVDIRFDAKKIIEFVYKEAPGAPFFLGVADNIGYYTKEEGNIRGRKGSFFEGCSAGLTAIGIDSTGNVRGCESMYDSRFNEGNLREKTIYEIWTDPDAFGYNRAFTRDRLTGRCAGCDAGDICAGGCRSYNYFTTGTLYDNPLCAKKDGGES